MIYQALKTAHLKLGRRGEQRAASCLTREGWRILAVNWRCRAGELDIVALDGLTMVFVEVKSLRRKNGFRPAGNLSARQRRRNFNAAGVYRKTVGGTTLNARFDLIEVVFDTFGICEMNHIRDYLAPIKIAGNDE